MRTLIVLCADERIIEKKPLFLNRHPDGKLLAEKSIQGIHANLYDEIVFTILEQVDELYDASNILNDELGGKYNLKIVSLKTPTRSPAESVYYTLKELKIEGEFTVRDSLNGIKIDNEMSGNFVAGLDLTSNVEDVFNVKSKSFIVTNEQNQILDVIEKRFRSDIISVGLYGFKKASDFIMAYEKLNDKNYPIKKLYLSNIISYLIGYKERVFHCVAVSFHEDWGSYETWSRIQKKYATFFVDADKMLGTYYNDEMAEELIKKLMILSNKKTSLVLFTRSSAVDKKKIYNLLDEKKIHCIDFICKVSYSLEQIMISDESDLEKATLGG